MEGIGNGSPTAAWGYGGICVKESEKKSRAAYNFPGTCSVFRSKPLPHTFMRKKILLIVGIVVAIVIGLYSGLFGMTLVTI